MCTNVETCKFGSSCNFAHSKEELRARESHFSDNSRGRKDKLSLQEARSSTTGTVARELFGPSKQLQARGSATTKSTQGKSRKLEEERKTNVEPTKNWDDSREKIITERADLG